MAGSVIWTVNLKLLLMYQKKELSYLQIPEMKQFSSNLPDSRYIFHGSAQGALEIGQVKVETSIFI